MKSYDFVFILVCLFVLRIVFFSASYADAACLFSVFAFLTANEILKVKKISNQVLEKVTKNEDTTNARIVELSNEMVKIRNAAEGIKAAVNFVKK
jgi:hypothetical protein